MFTLKPDDMFSWTVKAKVPIEGKHTTVQFDAKFRTLSQPRIAELLGEDTEGGSLRVLNEALISFTLDVVDGDGEEVTDAEERREMLLSYPYFVEAVSNAFTAGISGHRSKN